jgi:hypothetical protein
MATRRVSIVLMLAGALASLGASYRTQNFLVQAPTPELAKAFGDWGEYYRKQKALQWLGQEMPAWPRPIPLNVTVSMRGSGGATTFAFDQGRILDQQMQIEGSVDRMIASVLPHEITHTVFAHYFRHPVPRWADEGGSVLSEDEQERNRHDRLVRGILNSGRAIPLERLFTLTDYPRDVMSLYAEGYSVTNFLVAKNSRSVFLAFLAHGMRGDWNGAVRTHYGYRDVRELEQAWIDSLRHPQPPATLASAGERHSVPSANPASRVVVRQTVPPAQPLLGAPQPVYRGAAPEGDDLRPASSRLPVSNAPSAAPATGGFAPPVPAPASEHPGFAGALPRPPVRMGAPAFDPR